MFAPLWIFSTIATVTVAVAVAVTGTANTIQQEQDDGTRATENLADTIKLLREQVNALLDHRQEDYNALEESLKRAIEKNTELFVLRNEVKQLRKEVNALRGGNGNEAKNERLRVRWLGSAVTELQSEVAEVLRARNASEELAERSRMQSELALLKGDVAEVGRGIRNLGGRIAKIEAALGTVRVDIAAVKERSSLLSRTCADITSQLSAIQMEVKSFECATSEDAERKSGRSSSTIKGANAIERREDGWHGRGASNRRHGYSRTQGGYRRRSFRTEEWLRALERKISLVSATKRASLSEKRASYENQEYLTAKRVRALERLQADLSRGLSNASEEATIARRVAESSSGRLTGRMKELEEALVGNRSETKRELGRLGIEAARRAAELSLTREELSNLRRAVQALSVSASKLQERSDLQQEGLDRLNGTMERLDLSRALAKAGNVTRELEQVEDQYRLIVDGLPGNCEERDGLTLLAAGQGAPLLVSCHDGWIVVARRIDGMVDFDRTWNDYSLGFGSPVNEFWIGNEALHRLTRDNCTRLRIDLLDIYGASWRAEYDLFNVDSEETGYKLRVSGYTGNATDALSYQNGMSFSAKDRDMDISTSDCAANYHGGWWFSHCQHANLNGKYSLGLMWYRSDTNGWMAIASSEMSVQRKPDCRR